MCYGNRIYVDLKKYNESNFVAENIYNLLSNRNMLGIALNNPVMVLMST